MTKKIYCIGGANIDRKLKASTPLTLKSSNPVSSVCTFGGVARNVAQNLAHWTTDISLQCVLGNDTDGLNMLNHMQQLGVNVLHCQILDGKKTSNYYAVLNNNGELCVALADMDIYQEICIDTFSLPWENWQNNSLIFLDTNLPAELLTLAIQKAAERHLTICIDPVSAVKAQKIPEQLDHVFLIKPDLHEASALTNMSIHSITDCIIAGRKLQKRGVQNVVISLGKSGYVVVNEKVEEYIQTMQFDEVIDVSGAGDAFIAGILFGLQEDNNILEACQLGAAAAAYTIQSHLTVAEDITVSRLQAFIHNHQIVRENSHAVLL
ncbi:MAG: carbohydrate kinase, PfkB family [uncultured bacterium]|nr:MAG: carbohydrate kinase, PfkB family [uncultured bacterium]